MSKPVDKPDSVEFAKQIAQNLPTQGDSTRLIIGIGAGILLGKVMKHVPKK